MSRIAEIRNQEMMYRERALLETDRKEFWLAKVSKNKGDDNGGSQ
jgi:hypothetical protein